MSTRLSTAADAFFAYEWAYCATIAGADTEERYALRDQLRHEIAGSERARRALRDLWRYTKHQHGCAAEFANGSRWTKLGRLLATGGLMTLPGECTCGLDDVLDEARAVLSENLKEGT